METRERRSILELLHRERYAPEELARLLGIGVDAVCQAAFRGELRARIIGHDVVDIRRADIIAWLDGLPANTEIAPGANPPR